jgi:Flavodoxin-like fold
MPHLLHLDSSADTERSRSRAITATFAAAWRDHGPGHTVTYRDLHRDPLPHLADAALHWPPRLRPEGAAPPAAAEALQQELLAELISADVLLVGAPLYNYSLPSSLKAWIDHIHVPGVTAPFDVPAQPDARRDRARPGRSARPQPRRAGPRPRAGDGDGQPPGHSRPRHPQLATTPLGSRTPRPNRPSGAHFVR